MVAPKRMAVDVAEDDLLEITPAAPRRGAPSEPFVKRSFLRKVAAPAAALSISALAVGLLLIPHGDGNAASTEVLATPSATSSAISRDASGVSRDLGRAPLIESSPSVSASASPTAAPTSATPTASVTSAAPKPAPSTTAAIDYSTVGKKSGTRYATGKLNVRSGGSQDFKILKTLNAGAEVTITNRVIDGWQQVVVGETTGWVSSGLLSSKKPVAAQAPSVSNDNSSSTSSSFSTAPCRTASGIESSIKAQTAVALRAICGQFPKVKTYGGYRPGDPGYHGSGRALDIMVSGEAGWEIARWARANAKALGITEVIYQQKIWTTRRSAEGWRPMADRGSITANHYDHVHVSVAG